MRTRAQIRSRALPSALRRFTTHAAPDPASAQGLSWSHPAIRNATTRYPATLRDPRAGESVLKSGGDNMKIGAVVQKGRLSGAPIYTLTLEERATCPADCTMLRGCYGNRMHWARRWRAGAALEAALEWDLALLAAAHPRGFLVRLHVLGDFYSLDYVELWAAALRRHPSLNLFGFTHRDPSDPIGAALASLRDAEWPRFALRFSARAGARNAVVLDRIPETSVLPSGAVVCAEQWDALRGQGEERCCATCGFCWTADAAVAFVEH
jgi:hypothetical protein